VNVTFNPTGVNKGFAAFDRTQEDGQFVLISRGGVGARPGNIK